MSGKAFVDIEKIIKESGMGKNNKNLKSQKDIFQKDTVTMAKELLGKMLVLKNNNEIFAGYIVETEAYLGEKDKACHSYQNKKTRKNEAMFEKSGTVYIYTMHTHKMLNIVSCEADNPQAVLIRALEPVLNIAGMEKNRGQKEILISNGPGKLTKALEIDDRFNKTEIKIVGKDMFEEIDEENSEKNAIVNESAKESGKNIIQPHYDISKINEKYLHIDFENSRIPKKINSSARIGIPNKGVWTNRKLRFFVAGNRFVSGMKKMEFRKDVWK